jgi:hypothetical protein
MSGLHYLRFLWQSHGFNYWEISVAIVANASGRRVDNESSQRKTQRDGGIKAEAKEA